MSQRSHDPGEAAESPGRPTAALPSDLEDLRFVLQETRCLLLQQILAHDPAALSVRELSYRNPDLDRSSIQYHLRELESRDVVRKLQVPKGEQRRDLPSTFFAVTETGRGLLNRAGLLDEMDVWKAVYDRMERTEEIERIEAMDRPEPERD